MTTATVSAPGQIFLFGEHAVVYDQPALATAIDIKTKVEAKPLKDNLFEVDSDIGVKLKGKIRKEDGKWSIGDKRGDIAKLRFITKVSELTFDRLGEMSGIKLSIESDIPAGSGLGSSSAVTTATAGAISSFLGSKLEKEEIADLSYRAEKEIQGIASRTGVTVAVYGGFLRIKSEEREKLEDLAEPEILIGYTGKHGDTGKLVRKVKQLKNSRSEIIAPMIKVIGKITDVGIGSLRDGNLEKVGALMNANQNLLEGLQVSSSELRSLIKASRKSGALGSKLTGGGGGGCMIALVKDEIGKEVEEAIEKNDGQAIKAQIGGEGLKY